MLNVHLFINFNVYFIHFALLLHASIIFICYSKKTCTVTLIFINLHDSFKEMSVT